MMLKKHLLLSLTFVKNMFFLRILWWKEKNSIIIWNVCPYVTFVQF